MDRELDELVKETSGRRRSQWSNASRPSGRPAGRARQQRQASGAQGRKLVYKFQKLTDEDVVGLEQHGQDSLPFEEVDFSENQLTAVGLESVLSICLKCEGLRVVKLYKNKIDDAGADSLVLLVEHFPRLEELHLSHNSLSADGAKRLLRAAEGARADDAMPLWVRMEQNSVHDPWQVLGDLEAEGLRICDRTDQKRCTVRHCINKMKVHVPFFERQPGAAPKRMRLTANKTPYDEEPHAEEAERSRSRLGGAGEFRQRRGVRTERRVTRRRVVADARGDRERRGERRSRRDDERGSRVRRAEAAPSRAPRLREGRRRSSREDLGARHGERRHRTGELRRVSPLRRSDSRYRGPDSTYRGPAARREEHASAYDEAPARKRRRSEESDLPPGMLSRAPPAPRRPSAQPALAALPAPSSPLPPGSWVPGASQAPQPVVRAVPTTRMFAAKAPASKPRALARTTVEVAIVSNQQKLGIGFNPENFEIMKIKGDGLVSQFNSKSPDVQIAIGDTLLKANGVLLRVPEQYHNIISQSRVVRLTIAKKARRIRTALRPPRPTSVVKIEPMVKAEPAASEERFSQERKAYSYYSDDDGDVFPKPQAQPVVLPRPRVRAAAAGWSFPSQ